MTPFASRPAPPAPALPQHQVRSRWRKTQTTFGPVGRTVSTLLLTLPTIGLLLATVFADPFAIIGFGIWGFIIMPWGLRDVWKAGLVTPAR